MDDMKFGLNVFLLAFLITHMFTVHLFGLSELLAPINTTFHMAHFTLVFHTLYSI